MRRMNELWKSMPLALMFGLLLLHGCQGQDEAGASTTSQSVGAETNPTTAAAMIADVQGTEQPATSGLETQSNYTLSGTAVTNQEIIEKTTNSSLMPQQGNINPTTVNHTPERKNNITDDSKGGRGVISDQSETSINETVKVINFDGKQETSKESGSSDAKAKADKDTTSGGSSSAVFVSVLLTGLLLAGIIVGIYYFKCHRRTNGKGMKLAEESYTADEENQGNTLVSVAPLNQPEPQEKPSLNGESQEAVKPQTPPAATNGHSTTKTADTEL